METNYMQVVELTDKEQIKLYLKSCTKQKLAEMLTEANKHLKNLSRVELPVMGSEAKSLCEQVILEGYLTQDEQECYFFNDPPIFDEQYNAFTFNSERDENDAEDIETKFANLLGMTDNECCRIKIIIEKIASKSEPRGT